MNKQIFLHIGGEKTGTTTLQHFLTRNAAQLRRMGFHYPCAAKDLCFDGIGHFPVAASLISEKAEFLSDKSQSTLPFVLGQLAQSLSVTKDTTILSCEHLSSRVKLTPQLMTLRDALPAADVKVIYYLREPSDLALAAWSTDVCCGGKRPFNADDVTPENRYYNHLETLTLWGSVFGDSNLIVREYSRSHLIDGDIRKDFCALVGMNPDYLQFDGDEKNQSLDAQSLEVLRHINGALPEFCESESGWRRAQDIRELIATYIPSGAALKILMSDHEKNLIRSRFSDMSREINERYLAGRLSADWFAAGAAPDAKTDLRHFPDVDVLSALRETVIRIADANMTSKNNSKVKRRSKVKKLWKRMRLRFLSVASERQVLQ
jgi:hypothetical protein